MRLVSAPFLLTALWVATASIISHAQERERIALSFEAPSDCIGARELASRVERILGRTFFVATADADIIARGAIAREEEAHVFTLELIDRAGHVIGRRQARRERGSCHALDRSIAVIIATLVELPVVQTTMQLPDEEIDPTETVDPERPPTSDAEMPLMNEPPSWELRSGAGFALSVGLVPEIGMGGSILFGLMAERDWPALVLEARILSPTTMLDDAGLGARFFLADAHLGVCPTATFDVVRLGGCAEIGGGAIVADAIGLSNPRTGVITPLITARFALELRVVIAPFELRLATGVDIPIVRDPFVRDAGTERETRIHETAPVALMTSLTIGAIGGS